MKNIKRIFKDSEESFFCFYLFFVSCIFSHIIGTDVDGGVLSTNESREMSTLAPTVVVFMWRSIKFRFGAKFCVGLVQVGFVPIVAVTALTVGEFVEFFLVCGSGNLMELFL